MYRNDTAILYYSCNTYRVLNKALLKLWVYGTYINFPFTGPRALGSPSPCGFWCCWPQLLCRHWPWPRRRRTSRSTSSPTMSGMTCRQLINGYSI